jgi:uncharacterized protein (DUF58 family)
VLAPSRGEAIPGSGRLSPRKATGPILGSIFTLVAWAGIAHNSGSGWVQALGAVLGAVLAVGLIAPGRFVSRARVEVVSAPVDAVAGQPVELEIAASARVRVQPLVPEGETTFVGPRRSKHSRSDSGESHGVSLEGPGSDGAQLLRIVPERRGVVVAVMLDIASAAPFGLLWWSRRATLALPVEMLVAPRPSDPLPLPRESVDSSGDSNMRKPASLGEPRGVRSYELGDPRRSVHWRASAHTGSLMVREMELPAAEPIVIRVELPGDPDVADALASRALATVLALVECSRPVMLATREPEGERVAIVTGSRDAGRRLARAIPYGPGPGALTIEGPGSDQSPPGAQ